jgi:RNA polymerase sigma-70 factor (ECF subfamily)
MIPPPPPGLSEIPEQELVGRFREGGKAGVEAYSELVARYQSQIVRMVGYLLGNSSDAEDVAQEAFVRAFTAKDSFAKGDNFGAWIRTIATRVAFNCRRENATRQRYQAQAPTSDDPGYDRGVEARDLLTRALGKLSYAYREILVLRYVEELPLTEIAQMLNLGESAAKMRLLRARGEFWALQKGLSSRGT